MLEKLSDLKTVPELACSCKESEDLAEAVFVQDAKYLPKPYFRQGCSHVALVSLKSSEQGHVVNVRLVWSSCFSKKLGFRAGINFQVKLYKGNISEYLTDMFSFSSPWTSLCPGRFSHHKSWVVIVLMQHLFCDPSVTLETSVIPAVEVMAHCKMWCYFS